MKGFIKLAFAGIISFSSSAFSNNLVVDGKGKLFISSVEISNGVGTVEFKDLSSFEGIGDPNIECHSNKLTVINSRVKNNSKDANMSDKIWELAKIAYLEQVSVIVKIESKTSGNCNLRGIHLRND